jgi:hypothetical protein
VEIIGLQMILKLGFLLLETQADITLHVLNVSASMVVRIAVFA